MMSSKQIKLWIDDDLVDRAAPEGWVHVQRVDQAIDLLLTGNVTELSIDNDLDDPVTGYVQATGDYTDQGNRKNTGEGAGQGKFLIVWLEEQHGIFDRDYWPNRIIIHSGNPEARNQMVRGIENGVSRAGHELHSEIKNGKPVFNITK